MLAVPAAAGATTLFGSGSSAEQPIMNVLFKAYNKLPQYIRFNYLPDGGNAGVVDVQAGRRLFSINTRPPLPSDAGTTYFKLWLDGLCIAVNPSNSVSNLTIAQTKNIFTGVATNWSQGFGSNLTSTIDPIGRNSTAGLYTFFQQAVLGGATQSSNVQQVTSDGLVATAVSKDPNAIGYVGIAHTGKGSGVKSLDVNGVPCNQANIRARTTPCSAMPGASFRRTIRPGQWRSSSIGYGPASRPGRSSTAAVRLPRSTGTWEAQARAMDEDPFLERGDGISQDQRAELGLGALVFVVVALLLAMLVFVFHEAWQSFAHNGLGWFGGGGNVDNQIQAIFNSGEYRTAPVYTFMPGP